MNFRKLLSLDRSLIGFGDVTNRYRMGKHNLLPEFGNSGAENTAATGPGVAVAGTVPRQKVVIEQETEKRKPGLRFLGFRIRLPFSKPALVRPEVKTPLPATKPTLQGGIAFQTEANENRKAEQANHLLSLVTVVRNDLKDSGVEVLALRRPATPGKQGAPFLAPAEVEVPAAGHFTKVTTP